ncbi:MAG TPA: TIGR03435 family protein [Bryobacteraceae bacterium]|nr:TIGR03435 family protein [Bryobacteraceae bacterium]
MLRWTATLGPFLLLVFGFAQTQQAPQTPQAGPPPTEFEVATIKPWVQPPPGGERIMMGKRGGPGSKSPGQVSWTGLPLKSLLMTAYNLKAYQISGPAWLNTERYSITAKVPPDTSKEQVLVMLQNLLADRFKLKVHRETREIPIYEVVIGKNGPKLKESDPEPEPPKKQVSSSGDGPPPPPPPPPGPPKMGPDGCPVRTDGRGGFSMMMMPGRFRMCAQKTTMETMVNMLTNQLDRPIFDKTGLKGKYDFRLEYMPEGQMGMIMGPAGGGAVSSASQAGPPPSDGVGGANPNNEPAPPIAAAFQNQLGLKLEAKKAPAEILVVDSMERTPTEN